QRSGGADLHLVFQLRFRSARDPIVCSSVAWHYPPTGLSVEETSLVTSKSTSRFPIEHALCQTKNIVSSRYLAGFSGRISTRLTSVRWGIAANVTTASRMSSGAIFQDAESSPEK